ncbi:MAG TPA: hypothetical protein VFB27_10180, partial [Opitutaceae bacterium]|nr:hypothetical protein [Opitutaceae bacterium]
SAAGSTGETTAWIPSFVGAANSARFAPRTHFCPPQTALATLAGRQDGFHTLTVYPLQTGRENSYYTAVEFRREKGAPR